MPRDGVYYPKKYGKTMYKLDIRVIAARRPVKILQRSKYHGVV